MLCHLLCFLFGPDEADNNEVVGGLREDELNLNTDLQLVVVQLYVNSMTFVLSCLMQEWIVLVNEKGEGLQKVHTGKTRAYNQGI